MKNFIKNTLIFLCSFLSLSSLCWSEIEKKTFDSEKIKNLSVTNLYGDITITASESPLAEVKVDKVEFDDKCKLVIDIKDQCLVVKAERKYLLSRTKCRNNIEIKVPKDVGIHVNNSSGNLTIVGINGNIDYKIGNGKVVINGSYDTINGKVGNGSFYFSGICENIYLKSGNGDVTVKYTKSPIKGDLSVTLGNGSVEVYLPYGSKITTDYSSTLGNLKSDFTSHTSANLNIYVRTGVGDLTIQETKP